MNVALEKYVGDVQSYHYLRFPVADYRDVVIQHRHCYAVAFSRKRRMAIWCAYCVTLRDMLGANVLARNFHTELPEELSPKDYGDTDFDMGHLCPLASYRGHTYAGENNAMTNIVPQMPDLNRGPWLRLEDKVRDLSEEHHEVWVVCIPIWDQPFGRIADVDVPNRFGKVICWYDRTGSFHVSCYLLPQSVGRKDSPSDYHATLDAISDLSGIRPFGPQLLTKSGSRAK